MNRAALFTSVVIALSLGGGAGCLGEAPHDNPFDPASERFVDEGSLAGRITDRAGAPLSGAEVRLVPAPSLPLAEQLARSDAQGRFLFRDVPADSNYTLLAHKDGYAEGRLDDVGVRPGPTEELPALTLNALPAFTDLRFRTVHVSRWWPENDLYFLVVDADVSDADGLVDIEEVWLEIPALGYVVSLDVLSGGRFDKSIRSDSLPTASLQSMLGQRFHLNVRDKAGDVMRSAPQQLVRIIETTPTAAAPRDDLLLETNVPTLTWDPFPPTFPFTYRIDVFRVEINRDIRARQFTDLAMHTTSVQLQEVLPTGRYFWLVTVVDEFGNESTSKEVAFRIP